MNIRFVYLLGCACLVAAPYSGGARAEGKTDVLRSLAVRVGHVIGSASACPRVDRARVKAISDKITDVINSSTPGGDERKALIDLLNESYLEGAGAVNTAETDCGTAERALADLEAASAPARQMSAVVQPAQAAPVQWAARAVHGVTNNEIRFGAAVPLTGPNKDYGHQIMIGIETAFRAANDAGGVHGRMLRFVIADDGYEPGRTPEVMKQLYERDQVFGFFGNFGSATSLVAAPFALDRQALFYAAYTGASNLRRDPPDRYVFNYRASYAEETEAAVRYLVKVRRLKPEQIAVFAQQDAFGDSGFLGVSKAMRALRGGDGGFILRTGYPRNTLDVDSAIAQIKANKTPIKAVVLVATYRAAAKFIEKTRAEIPGLIYTNPSAVGSTSLRDELMLLGPQFAEGVIVTQVVPSVDGYSSLILEYKSALAKYFGGEAPDYVSLEYYIAARVLIEALKSAGPQLDSEKLVEALENMHDLDLGLGMPISFGRSEHQALHKVWGTQLNASGRYEPFDMQ
jgi:ABC-type branched-subunit amino acid transport system substrate-binding protein